MSADEESNKNVKCSDHGVVTGYWQHLTSKALIDPNKSDEDQVTLLHKTWSPISSIADNSNGIKMFIKDHEKLYRDTLYVILSIDWGKIHKIQKTTLTTAIETCASKLHKKYPDAASRCRILISIITNPWENTLIEFLNSTKKAVNGDSKPQPPDYPIINNQIVDYITSQPVEVLITRLAILIERLNCFDLALNLARVCRKCLKNLSPGDKNLIFDYYVGLLYKFKLVQEFLKEVLSDIKVEDGLELLDRYSRYESLAPNLLKKHGMKKASQTILNHLVTKVLQSDKATKSLEDPVFLVFKVWISLNKVWETSESDLQSSLSHLGIGSASTLHIYLVCKAVQIQFGAKSLLNSDMLQLLIGRLNDGHNEVKKHIQAKDSLSRKVGAEAESELAELKQEVMEAEHRLAEEFLLLGDLVQNCEAAHRECLLTAFSLRPSPEGLEALELVAPPEDTKENCGLLGLSGEAVGCSAEVCDDLLIILNSARWQLLKWETKWQQLKTICTEYMKDPDNFRYKKEDLANAQVPAYCDYSMIHEDRLMRRNRLKDQAEHEDIDEALPKLPRIKLEDDDYYRGPSAKKSRTISSSESDISDADSLVFHREVNVVSSGSEGSSSPDSKRDDAIKYKTPSFAPRDFKPEPAKDTNIERIQELRGKRHMGSPKKDHAPRLSTQNLNPSVYLIARNPDYVGKHSLFKNIPGMNSMDNFQPADVNPTVLVVQVGQGVPAQQQNSTPAVIQPPPDPPPPPQQPTNGPSANSAASTTEQLPKFQQVFGKSFQQQTPPQPAQQQTPQQPVTPQQTPPPPQQQPSPQQQVEVVQQAAGTVQQPLRLVANQASLLKSATPIQITQSSLEALIQAHPQLASALAGREGKIMCFKQGSNIILTDKIRPEIRPDSQPGTSGMKRPVKRAPEAAAPAPANSQLENELREFDAVFRSIKERDGSGSSSSTTTITRQVTTAPLVVTAAPSTVVTTVASFSQPPPLAFPKAAASKAPAKKQPTPTRTNASTSTSPSSTSAPSTPTPATPTPSVSTPASSSAPKAAAPAKTPPKASVEDEQTQKRIYEILSEYTEQLRNSPDLNNKPAPRRRSNPPTNPSPKRKKKSKEAEDNDPSEDSSSNLAQDSEEHDSVSESGSSLPAESPPAVPAPEPPPQPPTTVAIAIPVTQSKPLVLQRQQLMVVGKNAGQKLFRVIPANSNLRALSSAPTLLLQQMCKPDQLINIQAVRSVKLPGMVQTLSAVSTQQPVVIPFHQHMVKKEAPSSLIDSLLQASEFLKQEPEDQVKAEPPPCEAEEEEEEVAAAQSGAESPVPEAKSPPPRVKAATKCPVVTSRLAEDKKRRLVRQDNMQKSLSEECEDLGVDAPSTSELFPDADLPFELSNNSDSSLSYLDSCQRRRNNGASELNGAGDESGGEESPKRRKVCLTRPFAALKSRKEDESVDTDGSVEGDEAAKAKRAVKPRSSCACCSPAAPKATPTTKKLNGKAAGKKK